MEENSYQIRVRARHLHTYDTTSRKQWRHVLPPKSSDRPTDYYKKYQVYVDPYTKLTRLDLYQFDGSPMNPMFLAFSPPQMLPTVTLNPTATATSTGKKSKRTAGASEEMNLPLNANAQHIKRGIEGSLIHRIDLNMLWWAGVGLTIFGGAAYLI
jgi:hypothetical protein